MCDSIWKLKSDEIIFVKSITLQSIDNQGRLVHIFKVSKGKMDFFTVPSFSRDKTKTLKTYKWSENI
jgi:hypothetical protein